MIDLQVTGTVLFIFAISGIAGAAILARRATRRILRKHREHAARAEEELRAAWLEFTQAEEELGLELHIICVKDQIARHLRDHLGEGGDG